VLNHNRPIHKLILLLLLLTLSFLPSLVAPKNAMAACFYPHSRSVEYWSRNWGGSPPCSTPCVQVGECDTDCDGNTTCWGQVTSDTVIHLGACDPICE